MCRKLSQDLKKASSEQQRPSLHWGHSSCKTTGFVGTVRNAMPSTLGQCSESLEQWKQLRNLMHPLSARRALRVKSHCGKKCQGPQVSYRHAARLSLTDCTKYWNHSQRWAFAVLQIMSALCMVTSNPQQQLVQRPSRTKKRVGLGRSLVIPCSTCTVGVTPVANGTGCYKTFKYFSNWSNWIETLFSNKVWTCTAERQMEKAIWWCHLGLGFGGSHLAESLHTGKSQPSIFLQTLKFLNL